MERTRKDNNGGDWDKAFRYCVTMFSCGSQFAGLSWVISFPFFFCSHDLKVG